MNNSIQDKIRLIICSRSDSTYKAIRDRHYIPNHGCIGQQLHYIIEYSNKVAGIITGCSATWSVKLRDDFFGLTNENREDGLPSIINNGVFRLEVHRPNLGTAILHLWRKQVATDWEMRYGVRPHGFETYIIESELRSGAMYKADNWVYVGNTQGAAIVRHHGIGTPKQRESTEKKNDFLQKNPKNALVHRIPSDMDSKFAERH